MTDLYILKGLLSVKGSYGFFHDFTQLRPVLYVAFQSPRMQFKQ